MRPARPWRLEPVLLYILFLVVALLISSASIQWLGRMAGTESGRPAPWMLACGTGLLHLFAIGGLVPFVRSHGLSWVDAFGFFSRGWSRQWLQGVALTLPVLVVSWGVLSGCEWVLERLNIPHSTQAAVEAVRDASTLWERGLLFFFACLTAPVFEELLFRGVLWPFVRDRGYRVIGCLWVSLLFACIHNNTAALVPLWLLGIFWTWLYEWTGDLTAPILSHAIFNAANFLWMLLAEGGAAP